MKYYVVYLNIDNSSGDVDEIHFRIQEANSYEEAFVNWFKEFLLPQFSPYGGGEWVPFTKTSTAAADLSGIMNTCFLSSCVFIYDEKGKGVMMAGGDDTCLVDALPHLDTPPGDECKKYLQEQDEDNY